MFGFYYIRNRMSANQRDRRNFPVVALFVIATTIILMSCKDEAKNVVSFKFDPETTPTIKTYDDTMLVSDSGIMRYKVIAKTWEIFDRAKDPHWRYPDGFYFEKYDSVFNVVVTAKADTAWHFTLRKLWKLKGRVLVRNEKNETFSSDELYWDLGQQKVYSDKFVKIDRPEKGILQGKGGFEANQQMTEYEFKQVGETTSGKTIIYINEDAENREERDE